MTGTLTLNPVRSCPTPCTSGMAEVSVRPYAFADAERWDEFVRADPSATFFHQSGWMRVMERTFGYRCRALWAERDGQVTGVLPLFSIKNWIMGHTLISTPLAVYGGIASADESSYRALLERAKGLAREENVEYLELRNHAGGLEPGFHPNTRYVTFTCELSTDLDVNLKRLPKDTRYMIRKAQKNGLTVRRGMELLDDFYELLAISLKRHGTPLFPKALLVNLAEEFAQHIDLLMVYQEESPVSGVFTFLFKDRVLPYYAGASPDAPRLAANNLMYWELMKWAAENRYRVFDFGRSKRGTGSFAFKTQWNMDAQPLPYSVFLVKKKTMPDYSPANPRFEKATGAWSRLPLWFTKQAGPRIVRWFP